MEKAVLEKSMASFETVNEHIRHRMEEQLRNIEIQDKESQKIVEEHTGNDTSSSKENEME